MAGANSDGILYCYDKEVYVYIGPGAYDAEANQIPAYATARELYAAHPHAYPRHIAVVSHEVISDSLPEECVHTWHETTEGLQCVFCDCPMYVEVERGVRGGDA